MLVSKLNNQKVWEFKKKWFQFTDYTPHKGQEKLHFPDKPARFTVAVCGRRWGKSVSASKEIEIMLNMPKTRSWVVAPTYQTAEKVFREVWHSIVQNPNPEKNIPTSRASYKDMYIETASGSIFEAKSADNQVSLQGDRLTAAIVDEAHDVTDSARNEFMPALTDSNGRLIAIGVPQSNNWFRSYWERGQSSLQEDADYYSFSVPTTANPSIDPIVMEEARLEYPEVEFRQRFLAEWAEAEGKIFKNIDDCFNGEQQPWQKGKQYLMGLDVAKQHDYTVAYVIDIKDMSIVASDRFNGMSYTALGPRIASMYQEYKCQTIHLDATGVGEAVRDILVDEGCHITSFKFTNQSKAQLVSTLVAEIEHGRVHFPYDDEQLNRELKLFEGKVMAGGTIQYSAPPGYFDDCVMAVGLAVLLAKRRQPRKLNNNRKYLTFSNSSKRRFLTGVA